MMARPHADGSSEQYTWGDGVGVCDDASSWSNVSS